MPSDKAKLYYYAHSGQDPQLLDMQARVYGCELVLVPSSEQALKKPLWGSNSQALGLVVIMVGVLFALVAPCRAGTVSSSAYGATSTITWTVAGNRISYHADVTGASSESGANAYAQIRQVDSGGTMYNYTVFVQQLGPGTVSYDGTYDIPVGESAFFIASVASGDHPAGSGTNSASITPSADYKFTFHLPKNESGAVVHYTAMQDGSPVGSTTTDPGQAAHDWEITGLPNDHPVTLLLQNSVKEWGDDPLHPGQITLLGETLGQAQQAGQGTPSLEGATSSGGNASGPAPIVAKPSVPTPDAPHVSPKADSPAPPSVVHVLHPNSAPSGTSGVTKADLEQQTNDLADVSNGVIDAERANAGAVVDAINSQKSADTDNANGVIDATNKVKDAVDTLRGSIDQANGDASSSGGGGTGTAPKPSDATSLIDVTGDVASSAVGKLPGAPGFSGMDSSSTIPIVVHIPVPGKSDIVFEKTIDFSAAPYHGPIVVFRGLMLVLVTFGFFLASFWTVRGAFTTTK